MAHSIVNDEYPVESIPDKTAWGENYVVTFYDSLSGVGSLLSMGRWVIQPQLWRNMSYIALPNDRVLLSKNYGKSPDPKVADSGVFRLEIVTPGKRIRYVFDGPADERTMTDINTIGYQVGRNDLLQFDLTFESEAPIWDMHAGLRDDDNTEKAAANFNSPEGHIEQNGHVSGTIRYVGGETYVVKGAPATRDHSRGVRDLTRYKGHIWCNGIFPSGKSFHLFTMKTHGFDDIAAGRAGAIVDGKLHDVTLSRATQGWLESPDQLFQPFKLSFESPTLGAFEVEALELYNSVPLALTFPADHYWSVPTQSRLKNMTWVNEQKVRWRWNGETGYGHLERGNSRFASTDDAWISNFKRRDIS